MKHGISPKMKECYQVIEGYIKANDYSPSMREIAKMCGLSSSSSAHRMVCSLEERGWITTKPFFQRTIALTYDESDDIVRIGDKIVDEEGKSYTYAGHGNIEHVEVKLKRISTRR